MQLSEMTDRELDAAVAEKVMGLSVVFTDGPPHEREPFIGPWQEEVDDGVRRRVADLCPFYSTSIADAWQVVEKMRERGWFFSICDDPAFVCSFLGSDTSKIFRVHSSDNAPCAICLAALTATRSPGAGA